MGDADQAEYARNRADSGGSQPTIEWYHLAAGVMVAAQLLLLLFAGSVLRHPRGAEDTIAAFALGAGGVAGGLQWLRGWLWQRRYRKAYEEAKRAAASQHAR